jgi:hypothetical protein
MSYIVCAFYTENTVYEEIANKHLIPSIKELGIESDIVAIPNLGTWQANTSFKSTFALQMLQKHPDKNVVLLDVDAKIEAIPTLFENIPEQYITAAHHLDHRLWFNRSTATKEFLSGTLFLRNVPRTYEMVKLWIDGCVKSKGWEQRILARVIRQFKFPVFDLPVEYCWINTLPGNRPHPLKDEGVIIRHYQASRWTKQSIKQGAL